MKFKLIFTITAFVFLFYSNITYAQTSVNSLGNTAVGNNGEISYSIGELNYKSTTGDSGSLSAGVQQTYEVIPVFVNETLFDFNFKVHPNPTTDQVVIKSDMIINKTIEYQINALNGELISKNKIKSTNHKIDFRDIKPGVYILKIYQDEKISQSFKIIKTI